MLFLVLLNWLLWPIARTQFNLYNAHKTLDINNLQINCLHYHNRYYRKNTEKIEYCLNSTRISLLMNYFHGLLQWILPNNINIILITNTIHLHQKKSSSTVPNHGLDLGVNIHFLWTQCTPFKVLFNIH